MKSDRKHYRKPCPYKDVDVYRVLLIFNVTHPCIQHAVKKLLAAGQRGTKDADKDIAEAIESLQRWQEMRDEDRQATDEVASTPVVLDVHRPIARPESRA